MKLPVSPLLCTALISFSLQAQAADTTPQPAAATAAAATAEKSMKEVMKPCPSGGKKMHRGMGMPNRGNMHAEMEKIINTDDPEERRKLFAEHTKRMHGNSNADKPFMAPGRFSRELEQAERRQDMDTMMHSRDPAEQARLQNAYQQKMQRQMENRMARMRAQQGGVPRSFQGMAPQGQMTPPPPGPGQMQNADRGYAKHQFEGPSPQQQQMMLQRRIQMMEQQIGQMKNHLQQLQ